jgi:hypothetical protein
VSQGALKNEVVSFDQHTKSSTGQRRVINPPNRFRLGAACVIVVMLGAIFLVHLPHGFDVGKGGAEYAFMQLLLAIALFITGGGAYSLTSRLPKPLRKL